MVTSPYVIAIGASADGLNAIETVLRGLPPEFRAPVLVVLHRGRSTALAQILARHTGLPVTEPSTAEAVVPGHIYVAPPGVHLVANNGRVELCRTEKVAFSRPSIDVLFESVARVYGPRAIGVLLSGGGRDGSRGLQAIRARGGKTLVQNPAEATMPYMPQAAIDADGIDRILPLAEIGPALGQMVSSEPTTEETTPVSHATGGRSRPDPVASEIGAVGDRAMLEES